MPAGHRKAGFVWNGEDLLGQVRTILDGGLLAGADVEGRPVIVGCEVQTDIHEGFDSVIHIQEVA
jgi:hypothetical protein